MQTIEQLKQQRETLLQLADQVYAQIQEEERKQEKPKVKIEPGDFVFYNNYAYYIIPKPDEKFLTNDKFIGIRFNYFGDDVNDFSWIETSSSSSDEFAKFNFNYEKIEKFSRQDCDLSALGL